jgi:hypothetical protein
MSLPANRTYVIVAGRNYNPSTNGNAAMKFQGTINAGSTAITVNNFKGPNPIAGLSGIIASFGITATAVVGPGFSGMVGITSTTGNRIFTSGATASMTGTFDFYAFNKSIPSSLDSPITSVHVLSAPGTCTVTFNNGDTASFPASSMSIGGIYDYIVQSVTGHAAGSLLGRGTDARSLMI